MGLAFPIAVIQHAQRRHVDRLERVKTARTLLAGARALDHLAAEHHDHSVRSGIGGIAHRIAQVTLGVGCRIGHRKLRARKHDGLRAVLDEVREPRRRVRHRVGAVGEHEAVVRVVALAHDARHAQPIVGRHVRAVEVHRLHHVDLRDARELGHERHKILPRQRGRQPVAFIGRCDRAARCDNENARKPTLTTILPRFAALASTRPHRVRRAHGSLHPSRRSIPSASIIHLVAYERLRNLERRLALLTARVERVSPITRRATAPPSAGTPTSHRVPQSPMRSRRRRARGSDPDDAGSPQRSRTAWDCG